MPAYLPPHMRDKSGNKDSTASPSKASAERNPDDGYLQEEICHQFSVSLHGSSTLTAGPASKPAISKSTEAPEGHATTNSEVDNVKGGEELGFILLFKDQHPDWPSDIFCKSHLHLLPWSNPIEEKTTTSETVKDLPGTSQSPPNSKASHEVATIQEPSAEIIVPVFTQDRPPTAVPSAQSKGDNENLPPGHRPMSRHARPFYFAGHFRIAKIKHLPPRSRELVTILGNKWKDGKGRTADNWNNSLNVDWAVVTTEKMEGGTWEKNPMVPLKVKPERSVSVNEMLRSLRMKDDGDVKKEGTNPE